MSAKWVRSQRWDDEVFPAWAWPAKFVLRALSSIWLAVTLLSLVAVYGTLASIPVGMIAAIPSYLIMFGVAGLVIAVCAGGPTYLTHRALRRATMGTRMAASLFMFVTLFVLLCVGLYKFGLATGILERGTITTLSSTWRLFPQFCAEYRATTLRRIPGMEMSEMEFYAWWPLSVVLLTFVTTLTIATLRRIEFKFVNIGVLTVHTGIITISLGSVYYTALKQEGDARLRSGTASGTDGRPIAGDEVRGFFSREQPALWIHQEGNKGWNQRSLFGLPRYNEYDLSAVWKPTGDLADEYAAQDRGRKLDFPVAPRTQTMIVDDDIKFRVVGYASYCQLRDEIVPALADMPGAVPSPVRLIEAIRSANVNDVPAAPGPPAKGERIDALGAGELLLGAIRMVTAVPADRISIPFPELEIEYTSGMSAERWEVLSSTLDKGIQHALHVEIPALSFKHVFPITEGSSFEVTPGGYRIEVKQLLPQPPFPIITKGYENAPSSVAIVRITPPQDASGDVLEKGAFERYCYHRFPEIAQDMLDQKNERGMPKRVAPDAAIKVSYIDAAGVRLFFDEQPERTLPGGEPPVRLLMRLQDSGVRMFENLATGSKIPISQFDTLRLAQRWPAFQRVQVPEITPERDRQREGIGTHRRAAIALEVSAPAKNNRPAFSKTMWIPHEEYFPVENTESNGRRVVLPDGRELTIGFGRKYFEFPGFALKFADFEMTPFPHSDVPRDYRSELIVERDEEGREPTAERYSTSMNNPLLLSVPYQSSPDRSLVANALGRVVSLVAPNQYKISQVGWDPNTWFRTKQAIDSGQAQGLTKPIVSFTILGVGNNPGIYVIAAGAIMMGSGIPWAFYVKPMLLRAKKRQIQRELAEKVARGESIKPVPKGGSTGPGAEVGAGVGAGGPGVTMARANGQAKTGATK